MTLPEIERLFAQGRYLEVRLATEQAAQMDDHQREKQLYALTLSKSGAAGTAEKFFRKVYEVAPQNPENAGIMGGILKELFRYTREQHYAVEARKIYLDNFNVTANYYTGINAAAMHAVTGSMGAARDIARNLISGLQPSTTDFWEIVTLAEAKLLLKQTAEAIELYNAGRKLAGQDWGKVNSVFKQLWLLNHYFTVPRIIIKAFSPPNVAAFVGHMIDKVGARTRFPESIASEIKIQIQERIQLLNIQIGYCSLACGGDILFAEALTESLGDVNIILPFPKEDFLETSVRFAGESWVQRFEALEKKWPVHYITKERFHGNNDVFALMGRSLMGAAVLRAQMSHSECHLLTVLSGTDLRRKEGGTRDMLKLWPHVERHMNIDPGPYIKGEVRAATENAPADAPTSWRTLFLANIHLPQLAGADHEVANMLDKHHSTFADELLYHEINSGTLIIGMTSSHAAIRLTQIIMSQYKTKTGKTDYKALLHVGVVNLISATHLEGIDYDQIKNAMQFALSPLLMCSGTFATSLVLDPGKFTFHHAGAILDGMEMYVVESLAVEGR